MTDPREVILNYGKTGFGKTRWTRHFLRDKPRVLLLDSQREYDGFRTFDDVGDLIEAVSKGPRIFRYSVEWTLDFPYLCACAMGVGDCWLVIEEAQLVLPPHMEPSHWFLNCIYRGRHAGSTGDKPVSLLIVSQRPTTVHIAARSQWSRIVTFNQTEVADCKWLESVSGERLALKDLRDGEYFDITPRGVSLARLPSNLTSGRPIRENSAVPNDPQPSPSQEG